MRHIRKVIDLNRPQTGQPSSLTPASEFSVYEGGLVSSSTTLPQTSQDSSKTLGVNLLPPDEVMKRLISAYFANTGLLFPFIHQQEFLDTYQRFQASGFRTDVRRTWLGLLNMILAMATCTSCWEDSGSEKHFEESDIFYRRAQELCQTQMFRGTTLEIGQCRKRPYRYVKADLYECNFFCLRVSIFRALTSQFILGQYTALP